MPKCKFKTEIYDGIWECPLEALPVEEYCYWHKPKDRKRPSEDQIKELREHKLLGVYLKLAYLGWAHLENADLRLANLKNAYLEGANLENANFYSVSINSRTNFAGARLHYANLHRSYIDQTPTLRDAELFNKDTWMEINEIVAELAKKRKAINLEKLREVHEGLARNLESEGYFYYVEHGIKVVLFDPKEGLLGEPDRFIQWKFRTKQALAPEEILKDEENSERLKKKRELENQLRELLKEHGEEILYESTPENLQRLYEASYEVYNKIYYFYIQNGKLEEALQMHYRRNEVRRKLRLTKGWRSKIRAYLYDWLVLKVLTGYGIKPERPLIFSLFTILVFAFLFRLTKGIVKVVDGKPVPADWMDYLYHSVITFTSLGYANIQPNLTSHVPQVLVSIESFLGLLLTSLFLYTVTFRISR